MNSKQNILYQFYDSFDKSISIAMMELRKIRHDPTEIMTRAIQPILWLGVFGEVMTKFRVIPTGSLPYIDYLAPGILAQSVLFVAIFYGISAIWERDLGIIHKLLVTPTPREILVLGKSLAAGIRALTQAAIIYIISIAIGVRINFNPVYIILTIIMIILGSALFSTFSLIIASIVKTRERFMGLGQAITMPLFFASNAIYPISVMPKWLKYISKVNPLTYEVDALRKLMIIGGQTNFGLGYDFLVNVVGLVVLILICSKLYPRLGT